jgi:hypothetical protein
MDAEYENILDKEGNMEEDEEDEDKDEEEDKDKEEDEDDKDEDDEDDEDEDHEEEDHEDKDEDDNEDEEDEEDEEPIEEIYVEPFPIDITTVEGKKEYCRGMDSNMLLQMMNHSGAEDKLLIQRVYFHGTHVITLPPPPSIYHCISCNAFVNRIHQDFNWSICTYCLQMQQ